MCLVLGIERTALYRARRSPSQHEMRLRDAIQRVALAWPDYGYRMVTPELGRQGWKVGARRVRRIMREDNLLCLRRRKSWIRYPRHGCRGIRIVVRTLLQQVLRSEQVNSCD